jgi:ABC-type transport system involved in multi-copper enzyme maturation permease subunit
MWRTWAIARLTFWEGVRMRIVLVFLAVLALAVLLMPTALQGDGTVAGRLQSFLYYALMAVNFLLSLTTIFFSCSTLANEIRTRTLHLIVTKPVSRFQVLVGKWLGVNLLNLLILGLSGLTIYGFASAIKERPVAFARDALNVRDVVWTARLAASPRQPDFVTPAIEKLRQRKEEGAYFADEASARSEFVREFQEAWLRIPPQQERLYVFENLLPPRSLDTAFQVRFKARASPLPADEIVPLLWVFVDPDTLVPLMPQPHMTSGRSSEVHQFLVRATGVVRDGRAALVVGNPLMPPRRNAAVFEGIDSLQLLYQHESFQMNYLKALLLILLRLAFLSALGLLMSTFVSFPVACLVVCSVFVLSLSSAWLLEVIGANLELRTDEIDPYWKLGPYVRVVLTPLLRIVLPDFSRYDGVDPLIDGLYIPYTLVAWAAAHTLVLGTALLVIPGWLIFRRREVAGVQL